MKKTFAALLAAVLVVTALCACLTVSAATTNVAKGKSYTISQQFRQSTETWTWDDNAPIAYPDDGGELTDGKFAGEDSGYGDDAWIGFHGGAPEYVNELGYSYMRVDLGEVYALTELKLYVGSSKLGSGITAPTTVEFYVSEDGKSYTGLGELTPADTTETAIVEVAQTVDVSARYVEIRIKREGNWMFVTEFEAYADTAGGSNNGGDKSDDKTDDKSDDKTGETSTPSESTPSDDKVQTGDSSVLFFALLAMVSVAGVCVAVRHGRKGSLNG